MALHHKDKYFTKWMHMENGNVLVRRLHRIEILANDGLLHVLTGDKLPDSFVTSTGMGHKGLHTAQIMLRTRSNEIIAPETNFWPRGRDVLHFGLGVIGFLLMRFVLTALFDA